MNGIDSVQWISYLGASYPIPYMSYECMHYDTAPDHNMATNHKTSPKIVAEINVTQACSKSQVDDSETAYGFTLDPIHVMNPTSDILWFLVLHTL